jgi:hypothetical protein
VEAREGTHGQGTGVGGVENGVEEGRAKGADERGMRVLTVSRDNVQRVCCRGVRIRGEGMRG